MILDPDKALCALEIPKLVKQGKVALFLEGLNHRVQITLADITKDLFVCVLHLDVNNFLSVRDGSCKLRVDTLAN